MSQCNGMPQNFAHTGGPRAGRSPPRWRAAKVGPQRGGQMTSGESLGAAGGKRPRTVYCGTPYKRTMSCSGRRLVDMMMMMMMK
ncbi:jg27749 [Pararge aegeria aegeria]|uniref:Jg27749 protein n=1 Tax=Pararge aegeria aegeria TaxID=348720 RepID=A0A8S4QVZ9_9NEOP|nr:jg27749 [Pararge aegeria aegeria]